MTDELLLLFGCGVSFLALSGAYVFLRGRWLETPLARRAAVRPRETRVVRVANP